MRSICLFVEDYGHREFLVPLIQRLADENNTTIQIRVHSATGGFGRVGREFDVYVREDLLKFKESLPDLIVVAEDANCTGFLERRKGLQQTAEPIKERVVFAVPDPHIERWMLIDPSAFRAVLGTSCELPDQKCDRGCYKRLLAQAVKDAGVAPTLGGMEHAEEIVRSLDLRTCNKHDDFSTFLGELSAHMRYWIQSQDT